MILSKKLIKDMEFILKAEHFTTIEKADAAELHEALAKAARCAVHADWIKSEAKREHKKRACYFSAEFLMGRAVYNNLYCLGALEEVKKLLAEKGADLGVLEDIEDDALGNGGLGRLAACFLDSAATMNIPLDGYGIRYQYGLFKQYFENGFQKELPDDWQRFGDPWSIRRDDLTVTVRFAQETVMAVPYDMPIIGYGTKNVGRLRLWQCEAAQKFDFDLFNRQKYEDAVKEKNQAEDISRVLYPNDDGVAGKKLRLKQQYFFCSASLQDILRDYKRIHGGQFDHFAEWYAVQLNDTHPVVSIPELIRILVDEEHLEIGQAFSITQQVFSYTNHTIMAEALEKWDVRLFRSVLPRIYQIIVLLDKQLQGELLEKGIPKQGQEEYRIIAGGMIHMARLAVYTCHTTNGVAQIHTDILKHTALKNWYELYPKRFQNKTNGVTQRRWLGLCNQELSAFITGLVGDKWVKDLSVLRKLEAYKNNYGVLEQFMSIKAEKKKQLCTMIREREGVELNPSFLFDIQIKRMHEYKRQLLNAFSILDLYYSLKEGRLADFTPTAFIFGAKAAPGYVRAKGIIKFINEIARKVNSDPEVREKLAVVFVSNYNVSYAEKLVPAANISEQISTAGTEASGTGNMKLMMNGAVTLGTYDGANVEIVQQAGEENNYIFGARVEELEQIKEGYDPNESYQKNSRLRRVVDSLVDGTFDDGGTGMFAELHRSLLQGAEWHKPDQYFLLYDFDSYQEAKLRANQDYQDKLGFAQKCLLNVAYSGKFSSDRTIAEYAKKIWHVK